MAGKISISDNLIIDPIIKELGGSHDHKVLWSNKTSADVVVSGLPAHVFSNLEAGGDLSVPAGGDSEVLQLEASPGRTKTGKIPYTITTSTKSQSATAYLNVHK